MTLIKNVAQCRECGDVVESKHRHDMVWCKCGAIAVDGGLDYLRRAYKTPDALIEQSVYEEA